MTKEQDPILIGVMGVTGAGKSNFIKKISGDVNIKASSSMKSCTKKVQTCVEFQLEGRTVKLVDTPGFGDDEMSPTDVLGLIYQWLKDSNQEGAKLHGILYLHSIIDTRMGSDALTSLEVFKNVCGSDFFKNTVLVTTKWDTIRGEEREVGVEREQELKKDYWSDYLQEGAMYMQSDNTKEGCEAIVRLIATNVPIKSQLQDELDRGVELGQTKAGSVLQAELTKMKEKHERELKLLEERMNKASDEKNAKLTKRLDKEKAAREAQLLKHYQDLATLRKESEKMREEEKARREEEKAERKEAEAKAEKKREEEKAERKEAEAKAEKKREEEAAAKKERKRVKAEKKRDDDIAQKKRDDDIAQKRMAETNKSIGTRFFDANERMWTGSSKILGDGLRNLGAPGRAAAGGVEATGDFFKEIVGCERSLLNC